VAVYIKHVDGDDLEDDLRRIHDAVFGDDAPLVDFKLGEWWIAYERPETKGESPIFAGFAGYVPAFSTPGAAYFNRSGVLPSFRGQGLQRRLLRVRELHAKRHGYVRGITDTTENVPSARNLAKEKWLPFTPRYNWNKLPCAIYWKKEWPLG